LKESELCGTSLEALRKGVGDARWLFCTFGGCSPRPSQTQGEPLDPLAHRPAYHFALAAILSILEKSIDPISGGMRCVTRASVGFCLDQWARRVTYPWNFHRADLSELPKWGDISWSVDLPGYAC
jgi:hypothetical protein